MKYGRVLSAWLELGSTHRFAPGVLDKHRQTLRYQRSARFGIDLDHGVQNRLRFARGTTEKLFVRPDTQITEHLERNHMSRLVKALCLAGAVSAAVAIAAAPAVAATTYTVTAGSAAPGTKVNFTGKTTGAAPQVHFSDTTAGQILTCDSGTAKGFTTTGNARPATGLATITGAALKLTNCTGPGGLTLVVTGSGAWKLNATSYNATSGTTTFTITNIFAHVADPSNACVFDVSGTVQATYKNSTQLLSVKTTGSTLTLSNANCLGVLNNGDHATFRANFKVTATNAAFNPIHIVKN
jgi:hypothetical protein